MKLSQFSIGFSRTVNLGNYESCKVEAHVTIDVGEQDSMMETYDAAQLELRQLLEETWKAQHKPRNGNKT